MTNSTQSIPSFRVGMGYDVHKLVEGRDLYLGGIKIKHTLGLLGHSDADVLIHAICDALLGFKVGFRVGTILFETEKLCNNRTF
ncbi:2-C-methyl-D-erythritol 2,4-cyclodiphosphate synthase [Prevotella melaninogenica]|uniref:2-C-methyl-D-erythritol 2,4-cyclodiphosphate synthase n=1 Tax=Prevotella melaninogenica TaxID=28132 RepID=UPI002151F14F|nr:2-C-methyl-D-erythritol 2,4-cyclodiphosphate synthase [Prevotella melaninogenica]